MDSPANRRGPAAFYKTSAPHHAVLAKFNAS